MEACPKCNFVLAPEAVECPACGVILAKLKAISGLQRPIQPAPAAVPSNPYAPPEAQVEGSSIPPPVPAPLAPVQDVITPLALSALKATRPWLRFLVIYGFVMIGFVLLAAFGLLFFGLDSRPELMPVALFYFVYGGIGLAVLLPLHRSTEALGRLSFHSASACLESYAMEQSAFWRRMGVICLVGLILIAVGVVVAVVAGSLLGRF